MGSSGHPQHAWFTSHLRSVLTQGTKFSTNSSSSTSAYFQSFTNHRFELTNLATLLHKFLTYSCCRQQSNSSKLRMIWWECSEHQTPIWVLTFINSVLQQPYEVGAIIIPISQIRKYWDKTNLTDLSGGSLALKFTLNIAAESVALCIC